MSNLINPFRFAAVGGAFLPTDLANLEFWYDAQDASTFTLDGSDVDQWDDKSINGFDLAQGTTANKPTKTTDSGFDSVLFDGTDDVLSATGISFSITAMTEIMVCRIIANGDAFRLRTSANQNTLQGNVTTSLARRSNQVSAGSTLSVSFSRTMTDFNYTILDFANSSDGDLQDDLANSANDADVGTTQSPVTQIYLGAASASAAIPCNLHVMEWFGYSDRKSSGDITTIKSHLSTKYGL